MDKPGLRKVYRAKRLALKRTEVKNNSRSICQKLLSGADWQVVNNLHAYRPIVTLNEVDPAGFLSFIRQNYPLIEITTGGFFKTTPLPAQKFDLILVPVLAFDKENYRLGWGGGWYDRFMAGQPQALKIGLAFENGYSKTKLPREPHDIALDKVVTELKSR